MNVTLFNTIAFNGLLTIQGADKTSSIAINPNNISTISSGTFLDRSGNAMLGFKKVNGAVLTMNNGNNIHTYLPMDTVINAYNQAKNNDNYVLETKYNPLVSKPIFA